LMQVREQELVYRAQSSSQQRQLVVNESMTSTRLLCGHMSSSIISDRDRASNYNI
jgi:hypothetical protein